MTKWHTYKLGELINVQNGFAFKSTDLKSSGIPVIKIKNIQPPNIFLDEADYYPHELTSKMNQFLVKRKDILISMTGSHVSQIASAVGKVGRYNFDKPALLNQRVGKLSSKNKDLLDGGFLYYLISRPEVQFELASNAGGSANQANISPQDIKDLEFNIPELEAQVKIAEILSTLDDKIELNRRMNQTLEQMARTLFQQYFVNNIDEINLPEGWSISKLNEEFNIIMGQSPEGTSYNEEKKGIAFFQGRTDFTFRFPSFRIFTTSPKKFAKKNDVLLSVRAPVGDLNIALEDCCIGRGLAAIRHKKNFTSYTYYKFKNLRNEFEPYNGEGTVFGSINQKELGNTNTIIPALEKVDEFEKLVNPLDDKIYLLHKENLNLINLRDSLLPKLMSGEIDVMQTKAEELYEPVLS